MRKTILVAAVFTGVLQAAAQTTGVSHPENVPIMTSPEVVQQPMVYAAPEKPSAAHVMAPAEPAPATKYTSASPGDSRLDAGVDVKPLLKVQNADAMVVGDDGTTLPPRVGTLPAAGAGLNEDLDAGIVTRLPGRSNELPAGTLLRVRMIEGLTTKGTREGTEFAAELIEPVLRDGRVLLPAGSTMSGRVTDVHGGRRISGGASIHLQPMAVTLPDGTKYKIYAQAIDTDRYKKMKVDSEGTISEREHKVGAASALGLSTGSGAAAGAVLAGWPGALIGGAVGAGVATVVWLKQDRQTDLPAGTKVVFSLNSALAFGLE